MKKVILLIALSFPLVVRAQWNNESSNYTTGTLLIGASGHTTEKLKVMATGSSRSVALFGATGSGSAGIFFDASDGDFSGSDYGSLLQLNDLSITLTNLAAQPIYFKTSSATRMTISGTGNVGIGTTSPDSKLTVAGKIHAQEIKVTTTAGADFVFEADYPLRSLEETEQFIRENKHLPDIPSAEEMVEEGITLGEMNVRLLQKIEELTLYVIEQEKNHQELRKELMQKISELKNQITR